MSKQANSRARKLLTRSLTRQQRNIGTYESGFYVRNILNGQDDSEEYVNVVERREKEYQTPNLTRSSKIRRRTMKSLKTEVAQEEPNIFFQDDQPAIQQIQVKLEHSIKQEKTSEKDVSTPSPPSSPQKQSFFNMLNGCKSLAHINILVNCLPECIFTQFKLVRQFTSIHDRFVLYTFDPQQTSDKKFVLSSYKKVNIKETIYSISTIDYNNIESDDYQAGKIRSDFSRNLYKTHGKNNRNINIRFDDVLFGTRQVSLEVFERGQKKQTFWNIAHHNTVLFDKDMQASKRNIMMARSLPIRDMLQTDIVLKLKKVSKDSYSVRITKDLTPLQAFCFIVCHLDRMA